MNQQVSLTSSAPYSSPVPSPPPPRAHNQNGGKPDGRDDGAFVAPYSALTAAIATQFIIQLASQQARDYLNNMHLTALSYHQNVCTSRRPLTCIAPMSLLCLRPPPPPPVSALISFSGYSGWASRCRSSAQSSAVIWHSAHRHRHSPLAQAGEWKKLGCSQVKLFLIRLVTCRQT